LPANGLAFLIKSLGVIGSALILAGLFLALQGLPATAKAYAFLAIGFSFTTYPVVTYLIFWIWLPAIIGLLRLQYKLAKHNPAAAVRQDGSTKRQTTR
jgi:hypothetical protein